LWFDFTVLVYLVVKRGGDSDHFILHIERTGVLTLEKKDS